MANPVSGVIKLFLNHFAKVVLPIAAASFAAAFLCGGIVFYFGPHRAGHAVWLQIIAAFLIFLLYGAGALVYSFFMSAVTTLKKIAAATEDLIEEIYEKIKETAQTKVSSMNESITKEHAAQILDNSISEVEKGYKSAKSALGVKAAGGFIFSFIMSSVRRVLGGKIKHTVSLDTGLKTVFGPKAAVAGLVVFNMSLILNIILVMGYLAGAVLLFLSLRVFL